MGDIITVSIVVFSGDNIMFVKSGYMGRTYKLTLPGGKLRAYENIEECSIRVVKEASNVNISLDKKLSGVITRRNRYGEYMVTFVFLAEALETKNSDGIVYVPCKEIEKHRSISEFSKLIIHRIKTSSLVGLDRFIIDNAEDKRYIMYF